MRMATMAQLLDKLHCLSDDLKFGLDDPGRRLKYSGGAFENTPVGFGKMTWKDNSTYLGEWKNGQMDGEGTFQKYVDGYHAWTFSGFFTANCPTSGLYHVEGEATTLFSGLSGVTIFDWQPNVETRKKNGGGPLSEDEARHLREKIEYAHDERRKLWRKAHS